MTIWRFAVCVGAFIAALSLGGCNGQKVADLEHRIAELEKKLEDPAFERIRIVDKDGKEHAQFGLRKDGTPHLQIVDNESANRFLMRLHGDGTPVFVMWGKGGKSSAFLSVPGEGPPQMMMFDKKGTQALKLP